MIFFFHKFLLFGFSLDSKKTDLLTVVPPSIVARLTILGTSADWKTHKKRFMQLEKYELDWWVPTVAEILKI